MNILVINGSPKGANSITLQTLRYLEKRNPHHSFSYLHVGQRIKQYEKDFSPAKEALETADLLLFAYPVYTFIAPYQLHRFLELIKENNPDIKGKAATQVTTSKHFYDVTAHRFIEDNCMDLGLRYLRGLSADMDDLRSSKGQEDADNFFDWLIFSLEKGIWQSPPMEKEPKRAIPAYTPTLPCVEKQGGVDVAIVTNCSDEDEHLMNMITDFSNALPYATRVINIRKFPFSGGCLGCFGCAVTGKCVYKDGFDTYLRKEIQTADAIVYAFTIENHFTHSSFKQYDDRQFCNGHRTVTMGMPIAYLISGDYGKEENLRTIVEARSEVGGNYLAGVATDEGDTARAIAGLADSLSFAITRKLSRPKNFYGVGGTKIFRDLIYIMRGMMKADHKFYKKHKIYDFPQKQRGTILQMKLVGAVMSMPSLQKKMKGQMNEFVVAPYQKVIDEAKAKSEE